MEILKVENLVKTYGKGENQINAVDNISFTINKGEFVAIVGASGSGKSTLLHLIGGVDRPTSGKVYIDGKDIYSLNNDISLLVDKGTYLFPSEFRNCMMHYDLCDKNGKPTILEEKFDESIPFWGLVESCFLGKKWDSFFYELRNYIAELEEYLLTWFSVDKNKIKWD